MALFERTFRPSPTTMVLDVGGSPAIWEFATIRPRLTFVNLPSALAGGSRAGSVQVAGDGRTLPFRDRSFDIVFSNSVIEHVGTSRDQQQFALEAARVGRAYWIQTPNRGFPFEFHTMLPLVHYLPKSQQRRVLQRFTVWEWLTRPTREERAWYVDHLLTEMNLLDAKALHELFPEADILTERLLGLVKSIIALKQ